MALHLDPADRAFQRYCRHGRPGDLGVVFDRTAAELLRVAVYLCGNRTDAEDVLQRTFLSAIEGRQRFDRRQRVLPWLCGIAVNHARGVQRDRRRRGELCVAADTPAEPLDVVADRELLARVAVLRGELGSPYREVLDLHLEHGMNAREVAARLGRPAGTVRTQLVRALDILRRRLPSDVMAGLLPVMPEVTGLAAVRAAVLDAAQSAAPAAVAGASLATLGTGSLIMSKKILVSICVLALIAGATLWQTWPSGPATPEIGVLPTDGAAVAAEPPESRPQVSPPAARVAASVPAAPPATLPTASGLGSVRVTLRWQHDQTPAAAVGVTACRPSLEPFWRRDAVSDTTGTALLADLAPGRWEITAPGKPVTVEVVAGRETPILVTVLRVCEARGRVVDAEDRPVAGAIIWVSSAMDRREGHEVTRSDAEGRFRVALTGVQAIGARKEGHAPSHIREVAAAAAGSEIVLTLRGPAASVRGTVRDVRGAPVAGARVLVGDRYATVVPGSTPDVRLSLPAGLPLFTDTAGVFAADGIRPGPLSVQAWAAGFAPWEKASRVEAGRTTELEITLTDGATVEGTVRDAAGAAVAGASIVFGGEYDWARTTARSTADGRYRLTSLPAGPVALTASRGAGETSASLELSAGASTVWDPVFGGQGDTIAGTVLGPDGTPFAGYVRAQVPGRMLPVPQVRTGKEGRFELTGVGIKPVELQIANDSTLLRRVPAVPPGKRDLVVRLTAADLPSARIRGRLVDEQGQGVAANVIIHRLTSHGAMPLPTDAAGRFAYGPVPAGVYELSAHHTSLGVIPLVTLTLTAGEERVLEDLVVKAAGTIEATVRDTEGRPVAQCYVSVFTPAGQMVSNFGVQKGTGKSLPLQPGRYLLLAHLSVTESAVGDVTLPAGGSTNVTLVGVAGARVRVRAAGGDENQGADARVVATSPDGRVTGIGQARGQSNDLRLPPGRHQLEYRGGDDRRGTTVVEVQSIEKTLDVEVELSRR